LREEYENHINLASVLTHFVKQLLALYISGAGEFFKNLCRTVLEVKMTIIQ
jgi:hypothetical protein